MSESDSDIIRFYTGKVILLTGATGFVGKLILERLLRKCRVGLVYILLREKKNKSEKQRFEEIFDSVPMERLKKECPDYLQHVRLIHGDLRESNLKVSASDWALLHAQVEVVFHCAATVRFDQDLRTAFKINVSAVRDMIEHARQMKKLVSYVHVSTAYANCYKSTIEEQIYAPPMTAEQLETLLDTFKDDWFIKDIEHSLLQGLPNTYTLSKCVAEELVSRMAQDHAHPLPLAIVRPSMIISTYKEPTPGYINNIYGPTGVSAAVGGGLLHTLNCISENKADIVPCDYVVSAIIAVGYDHALTTPTRNNHAFDHAFNVNQTNQKQLTSQKQQKPRFEVYNYSAWKESINWDTYMKYNHIAGVDLHPMKSLWTAFIYLNRYLWLHNIMWIIFHTIPGHIMDTGLCLMGKQPMLVDGYKKLSKFTEVIGYFAMREWQIPHTKVLALADRLSETDRELFEFRMSTFHWPTFSRSFMVGLRIYIIQEPLDNMDAAMKRYRKIEIACSALKVVGVLILVWMFNCFLKFFGYQSLFNYVY